METYFYLPRKNWRQKSCLRQNDEYEARARALTGFLLWQRLKIDKNEFAQKSYARSVNEKIVGKTVNIWSNTALTERESKRRKRRLSRDNINVLQR